MTLRAMLFIGLGGTGGKVLGVIQSTLTRRLQSAGVPGLPDAWQFLHMDLPSARDANEGGMDFGLAPTDYFPLTRAGDMYSNEHQALKQLLGTQEAVDRSLTNWAPRPGTVPEAVDAGGGQLRAVGRLVALAHLRRISDELQRRLNTARTGANTGGLYDVASALKIKLTQQPLNNPLVVVISSLAGASGAGIVGDVLDVLRNQGIENPLVNLFTPEVFTAGGAPADEGLAPNALTAILELMAADWSTGGKATNGYYQNTRQDIYLAQGLPANHRGGALGYYLVGAKTEKGSVFDSPQDLYRVVGSMYAELALDQELLKSVDSYLMTNFPARRGGAKDLLGLSSNSGTDNPNLMGMGFGKLSVGREYFAQYALHRLLRLASDQLLEAHLDVPASLKHLSRQELLERAIREHYPSFVNQLRLNELDTPQGHKDQIRERLTVLGSEEHKAAKDHFAQLVTSHIQALTKGRILRRISSAEAGAAAHTLVGFVSGEADDPGSPMPSLRVRARGQFLRGIAAFEAEVQAELAEVLPEFAATLGLPVTVGMLKRLVGELRDAAAQLETQSRSALTQARQLRDLLTHVDPQQARSFAGNDLETISHFTHGAELAVDAFVNADELTMLARLARDLATNLVQPWVTELEGDEDALRQRVDAPLPGGGTLRKVWPSESGAVPGYLRPSKVELTLDDIELFPSDFLEQIAARMPYSEDDDGLTSREQIQREAVQDAVRDIITGRRDQVGSALRQQWATDPVAEYGQLWVSRSRTSEQPRSAEVRVNLTLDDLENRALAWLTDPEESTRKYLDCTLGEYLNPSDTTDAVLRSRHERMVNQFGTLLDAALPLISVNNDFHTWIHGQARSGSELILGELDAPALAPDVQQRLGTAPLGQRLESEFRARVGTTGGTLRIGGAPSRSFTLLSVPLSPVHLLAVDSIMQPVASQPSAADSSGWRHRRSRPLAEVVPLSLDAQVRILTGLYGGRLLGEVEFIPEKFRELRVRRGDGWGVLPVVGLREWNTQHPSRDLPGRVLEAVVTAMVEAYRRRALDPLGPLQRLYELGGQYTSAGSQITAWVAHGTELPHSRDSFLLQPAETSAARSSQLTTNLADFRKVLSRVEEESGTSTAREFATFEVLSLARHALDLIEARIVANTERN